jgi:hypothetical protein
MYAALLGSTVKRACPCLTCPGLLRAPTCACASAARGASAIGLYRPISHRQKILESVQKSATRSMSHTKSPPSPQDL